MTVSQHSNRAKRQDNRRGELLNAAARLFRERGFHATSMRDIAARVGMLSGSIYYHFASKEEMLLAIYAEGVRRAARLIDAAIAGKKDPWERFEAACKRHFQALVAGNDYMQVMIRTLPRETGALAPRLAELRDEYEARFRRLIDDLELPEWVSRRYFRLLVVGALNWAHVWYHANGDSPEDIAATFLEIIRRGVAPAAPGDRGAISDSDGIGPPNLRRAKG